MAKILGIDPGTNSIGFAVRNTDIDGTVFDQLDYFSSVIFTPGVGNDKQGEYSYASLRRKYRMMRRHYQVRKYRKWATLQLLIENSMCPLTIEQLDGWRIYNKSENKYRHYPDSEDFLKWVRLDFDGDGKPDYTSPFQLRAELATRQFDFNIPTNLLKLGRALYHIAQRRGFKSSKLDKSNKNENYDEGIEEALKESEQEKAQKIKDFMTNNNLRTVGEAFALLEKKGVRIHCSVSDDNKGDKDDAYSAIRSQYKDEIKYIFDFQNQLSTSSPLFARLVSTKPDGTIFYQRPLRSQKGNIGRCTMEPTKQRCAISHPDYETFRAYSFLNNIRYRRNSHEEWQSLSDELREHLYNSKFLLLKTTCTFEEIRKEMTKQLGGYKLDKKEGTINYSDNTSVSLCPISARLKRILGDDWQTNTIKATRKHPNGEEYYTEYDYNDLWNICFQANDEEFIKELSQSISLSDEQSKQFIKLWGAIGQGYAMLSLKAIRNINRFLKKGIIYSHAVLLAKLPELFGEKWQEVESQIINQLNNLFEQTDEQRTIINITNTLIAKYKSLPDKDRFAHKDFTYQLQDSDIENIKEAAKDNYGEKTWTSLTNERKEAIIGCVCDEYQNFFADSKREYRKLPKVFDLLQNLLVGKYGIVKHNAAKIYHPSMIEVYPPAKFISTTPGHSVLQLGKPDIGAIKNPMAMRVMHIMRRKINELLRANIIDEDTSVIVEIPREMNDANRRKAIETYQRHRETENKVFEKIIKDFFKKETPTDTEIDSVRLLAEQSDVAEKVLTEISNEQVRFAFKQSDIDKMVVRYRLWLEQNCISIYTGKTIPLSNLFKDNNYQIEHTIPRSRSFDNSLANKTICETWVNQLKNNRMPSELDDDIYNLALRNIEPWRKRIEHYRKLIQDQINKARTATTKDIKDKCIQKRHIYQMHLDYWTDKVSRFEMKEITEGFLHRQLTDTQIISKYMVLYLKSLFHSVSVQKGNITSEVRKMLGIQSADEKKDRSMHSHHAIDAATLTLMPPSSLRNSMLKLFYQIQEAKSNEDAAKKEEYKSELNKLIRQLHINGINQLKESIQSNILVHHITNDRYLQPTRKRFRVRGKIVKIKDSQGNEVVKWMDGDTVRGQLHKESLLGAIKTKIKGQDSVRYVIRKDLNTFKDWKELEKAIVNKDLIPMMKGQFQEGTTLAKAISIGIYMLDKNGNKINKIRHVRCIKAATPIVVRDFASPYLSKKEWKQHVYAENDTNAYEVIYWDGNFASKMDKKVYRLFDAIQYSEDGKFQAPRHDKLKTYATLYAGMHVLLFTKTEFPNAANIEDVKLAMQDMPVEMLNKRLYVMTRIYQYSTCTIQFEFHSEARNDAELEEADPTNKTKQKNGYSIFNLTTYQPRLLFVPTTKQFFLIEGKDFKITIKGIEFL